MMILILFFGGVLVFTIAVVIIFTKCNETQQLTVLKWGALLILIAFMINSESYRLKQGEQIEKLQVHIQAQIKQIESLRFDITAIKAKKWHR